MTHPDPVSAPGPFATDPSQDGVSVDDLASRFWERLRLFAARRLGSVADAEDVAQETLRRVTEAVRAGRLRERDALPGFVFQTALNICHQQLRSADREARSTERLAAEREPEPPSALTSLITKERAEGVHRALARLAPDDRELLRLIYFQELDPEVIARQWGLTPGALRVRKHRAIQRLAQLVDDTIA